MTTDQTLEIFLVATPGLEDALLGEAIEKGFKKPKKIHGGINIKGSWKDLWRANLELRGASRILVRIGAFRALHLAQLDKRARRFDWQNFLRPDVPVRVDVTCKNSRIYHQKAAAQRFETAIHETLGAPISEEAEVCVKVRIQDDMCTVSIDTSGEALHKRGHKEGVNKAPMRETIAALLLRQCGFKGNEPLVDPMCGSGTFVLEAAEIAARLNPGRTRSFAFEQLVTFDPVLWQELKENDRSKKTDFTFYGFDRDQGAIDLSKANAERANLSNACVFQQQVISDLVAPCEEKGLVIINPPYGVRIGETKKLTPLYQTLGHTLQKNFQGWRVALITNQEALAKSTGLPFDDTPVSFSHGGIRVKLYTTASLL